MPPPCQPEGMAQAWNAEPGRQSDRVVLGGPNPSLWHWNLEAEPVGAGGTIAAPIETRMIGQNLQSGPHNEQHKEHIEEVLQLQPPREARVDRWPGLRDSWMMHDESCNVGDIAQTLRE